MAFLVFYGEWYLITTAVVGLGLLPNICYLLGTALKTAEDDERRAYHRIIQANQQGQYLLNGLPAQHPPDKRRRDVGECKRLI